MRSACILLGLLGTAALLTSGCAVDCGDQAQQMTVLSLDSDEPLVFDDERADTAVDVPVFRLTLLLDGTEVQSVEQPLTHASDGRLVLPVPIQSDPIYAATSVEIIPASFDLAFDLLVGDPLDTATGEFPTIESGGDALVVELWDGWMLDIDWQDSYICR
jgi:hypothetical protein